jgi:hypothetical protein
MDHLTKEQIKNLVRIEGKDPSWFGNFDLFVKGFGISIEASIALGVVRDVSNLSDRTVQTINEIANLTEADYKHILRLLFDDAMVFKAECCSSEPPPKAPPTNWLRRIFTREQFVELAADDPRHPLFGITSPEDIPARVKWENFFVDDAQETEERIAFLTCQTPWDVEHGREVAIRNGVPVGINSIELNPYFYSDSD